MFASANWDDLLSLSMNACVRACVRARWCVPKSSWLRWCSRWVGCDSPSLPILLLLSDRLWCQIWLVTDSGSCAVVCQHIPVFFVLFFYFFISSLHRCLIWAFHNLCDPFPALKSFSFFQTTTDKWFIYSQLPVICTHTLQPEGKKEKWKASKKQDNEVKSLWFLGIL